MAEPQKNELDLINDTETLRRLWNEGIASGKPEKLDFDEFLRDAEKRIAEEKRAL